MSDRRQLTVDEGVQDGHGAVGDTSVGVNLLENCIDALVRVTKCDCDALKWFKLTLVDV